MLPNGAVKGYSYEFVRLRYECNCGLQNDGYVRYVGAMADYTEQRGKT